MKIIKKYKLNSIVNELSLYKGAEIISCAMHNDDICIWAIVNPKHKLKTKIFHVIMTDQELKDYDDKHYIYIETIINSGMEMHIFEIKE